jgi:hypothetical protein
MLDVNISFFSPLDDRKYVSHEDYHMILMGPQLIVDGFPLAFREL